MLATLLESRAPRQSRGGGAALSASAHVALVGLVAASTARHQPSPVARSTEPVIHFRISTLPRRAVRQVGAASSTAHANALSVTPVLIAPLTYLGDRLPSPLPPITIGRTPANDAVGLGATTGVGSLPRGILDGGGDATDPAGRGVDLLVRILTNAKPRYPEPLREAQVEGSVLLQFTIDTTGRIDLATVRVLSSTHPLFTRSVLEVLPLFRFRPAEAAGHRVAATGEMPFEFSLLGAKRH